MAKKSPNKEVTFGKGLKCQNCNNCSWRFMPSYSTQKILLFYCTNCMLIYIKQMDFKIPNRFRLWLRYFL